MPRQIPEAEFEAIVNVIAAHPDGATIKQIKSSLEREMPRRTLQHRLAHLVEQNRIRMSGEGRGTRYFTIAEVRSELRLAVDRVAETQRLAGIPRSKEGKAVEKAVSQPTQARQPVGYDPEFLEAYRPNLSFYLDEGTRKNLRDKGQTPDSSTTAGTYVRRILQRLLIDLSWNSSRLEGNTYSLLETERLLSSGVTAEGKTLFEAQMILNHKDAIELLVAGDENVGFNSYTILNLHALLSHNLLGDPAASGRLRGIPVGIGQSVYHPLEIPQRIEEYFQRILEKATDITDPFEQAFFVLVHLPYLQPFEDVNKRVSRLAVNLPLIRHNLCPISFVDVDQQAYTNAMLGIYELNRVELLRDVFVWAYERSCARYSAVRQSLGEPDPFRLRYREKIAAAVAHIVSDCLDRPKATHFIQRESATTVPENDRVRFVEVVETELMSLHEGNIARYRLPPSQFKAWKEGWE